VRADHLAGQGEAAGRGRVLVGFGDRGRAQQAEQGLDPGREVQAAAAPQQTGVGQGDLVLAREAPLFARADQQQGEAYFARQGEPARQQRAGRLPVHAGEHGSLQSSMRYS